MRYRDNWTHTVGVGAGVASLSEPLYACHGGTSGGKSKAPVSGTNKSADDKKKCDDTHYSVDTECNHRHYYPNILNTTFTESLT